VLLPKWFQVIVVARGLSFNSTSPLHDAWRMAFDTQAASHDLLRPFCPHCPFFGVLWWMITSVWPGCLWRIL
jgi:hypothetical protein